MKQVPELVDLPDAAERPLVHPLDVPEARRAFRRSWLLGTLTNPVVGLCLAALIYTVTDGHVVPVIAYIVPVIAAAAHIGLGAVASRYFASEAWAYIPRGRQDRERALPAGWALGSALVTAGALTVAVLIAAMRLGRPDVPSGVREFVFGATVGIAVLVVGDGIRKLVRHRGSARRSVLSMVPGVVAVVASVVIAYRVLFGPSSSVWTNVMLLGGAAMLAVGAGVGMWKRIEERRASRAPNRDPHETADHEPSIGCRPWRTVTS